MGLVSCLNTLMLEKRLELPEQGRFVNIGYKLLEGQKNPKKIEKEKSS